MIGHCSKHIRVPKPNHAQVTACRAYPLSKSIPKPLQIQLINKAELYKVKFPSGTHTDKRESEVCTWASRHGCQKISQSPSSLQDKLRPSKRTQEAIQVFYLGLGAPGQIVPKPSQPVLVGGICCTTKIWKLICGSN